MSIAPEQVRALHQKLRHEAEDGGYHINPDEPWTLGLLEGILKNEERYGYWSCPCRLASGRKDDDLDIICPCDYRDADLHDYGACYCALYVSDEVFKGLKEVAPVPERRPTELTTGPRPRRGDERRPEERPKSMSAMPTEGIRLWRCRVCGYLCAREHPPGVCPICKAKAERFEPFVLPVTVASAGPPSSAGHPRTG